MNIDEGQLDPDTFEGRKWEVSVSPAADARAEAKADKEDRKAAEEEKRHAQQRERLLAVLRTFPNGETERELSRQARPKLNPADFQRAILALLQEGRAARCEVVKNGRPERGYKPTGK